MRMELFTSDSGMVQGTLALLLLCSVSSWSIALFKLWRQIRDGKSERLFRQAFWGARDWPAAQELTRQNHSDFAVLGQTALNELQALHQSTQPELRQQDRPRVVLEQALRQKRQSLLRYRERGLAELATIGSTAPFIGLFGTVWGIMHALRQIGLRGTASLDVVAGPIGDALISTAIGIATALPAVLAYNYFLRRLRVQGTELEGFAHDFLRLALKHGRRD